MADIIANTLKVAILNFIRPPPWAMTRAYLNANDYPLALPSGFTSFLSSWPLQVLFASLKTPILTYDYSGSSRDQDKELHQGNWFWFGYWLDRLKAYSWRINLESSVSKKKLEHHVPIPIWIRYRQLFVPSQSGGSSSPVTLFIPASLLNISSLKPSFSESLSSDLGGYM